MPEYMDYDSTKFEYKNNGQRIRSNIGVALSVLFLVAVVVWVCVRLPQNTRSNFNAVSSKTHSMNEKNEHEKNEFVKLYNLLCASPDEKIAVDAAFKSAYPSVTALIKTGKKTIADDKVKTFEKNGCFVLSKPYIVSRDINGAEYVDENSDAVIGVVGADVVIFKYEFKNSNIHIGAPVRFSLRYHNRAGENEQYIKYESLDSERFKLNFYSASVCLYGETSGFKVRINLNEAINKEQAERNTFGSYLSLDAQDIKRVCLSGGGRGDKFVEYKYSFLPSREVALKIDFNDLMYNKFEGLTVSVADNSEFSLKVN